MYLQKANKKKKQLVKVYLLSSPPKKKKNCYENNVLGSQNASKVRCLYLNGT